MKTELLIGDSVFNSPVGPGTLTGVSERGYPQVNAVTVARLIHKDDEGNFHVCDPNGTYAKGDYELFIDDERELGSGLSESTVVARSSSEALSFVKAVCALPKKIYFDHDLGGDDTSIVFIKAIIDLVLDKKFEFRKDFAFEVHSQNPIGKKNIEDLLGSFLKTHQGEPNLAFPSDWLIEGNLLYRLSSGDNPVNTDEINVTQAGGSRKDGPRNERAAALLDILKGAQKNTCLLV